jgi:hypothetical protein
VRRWLLGALAVCFVAVATAIPARANVPADVVVIGVPGLRWSDVQASPELTALVDQANVGSISVRTAGPRTCPIDGWLTISAGTRARASEASGPCPAMPAVQGSVVAGWQSYTDLQSKYRTDADIGLLGASGNGLCGFGPGGAVADVASAVADYLGISEDTLQSELESGKSLATIAQDHGKTKDGVKQAIHDATKKELDEAVKDQKVTQTVADQILAKLDANLETLVTTEGALFHGRHHGFGFKLLGPGDPLGAAATYIGISRDQLETELASGKTLAEVAQDHGKTKDGVKQAIHDATKSALDQAVKDQQLTQSVADQILAKVDANLETLVTTSGKFGHHWRGGFGAPPPVPDDDGAGGAIVPPAALPVGSA